MNLANTSGTKSVTDSTMLNSCGAYGMIILKEANVVLLVIAGMKRRVK